jgi:hypothetical protein
MYKVTNSINWATPLRQSYFQSTLLPNDLRQPPPGCVKDLSPQVQLQAREAVEITAARAVGCTRG